MKASRIGIKNYKSFNDTGISMSFSDLTAIVGENSAGKTNVLEALDIFFNGGSSFPKEIFHKNNINKSIEIKVSFSIRKDHDFLNTKKRLLLNENLELILKRDISWDYGKDKALASKIYPGMRWEITDPVLDSIEVLQSQTKASIQKFLNSAKNDEILIQYFLGDTQDNNINHFENNLGRFICEQFDSLQKQSCEMDETEGKKFAGLIDLNRLPAYLYLPVYFTVEDETKTTKGSRFKLLFDYIVGSTENIEEDIHIRLIKRHISKLYKKRGIADRQEELNKKLQDGHWTSLNMKLSINASTPSITELIIPTPIVEADDGIKTPISDKGHGMQRMAIFELLQAYVNLEKNNSQPKNFILAIEEPELFLHPTYKRELYSLFQKLCNEQFQLMYTTHDPLFISLERFDDIRLLRKEVENNEIKTSVSQVSWKFFEEICKTASDKIGRYELFNKCHGLQNEGFFAKKIIIVEGDTEVYSLPIYFKLFNFNLDAEGIVIVQAGSVDAIEMMYTIFNSFKIPCYVIFDADRASEDMFDKYEKYCRHEYEPISDKEKEKLDKIPPRAKRNQNLQKLLNSTLEPFYDFPPTTVNIKYTCWERYFEESISKRLLRYVEYHSEATAAGIKGKPLFAKFIAEKCKLEDFPDDLKNIFKKMISNIRSVSCTAIEEKDEMLHSNIIDWYTIKMPDSLEVFPCVGGRGENVETDKPLGYAKGEFPKDCDFLVKISGHSMESLIPEGSCVAIKRSEEINPGEIGVFVFNGELTCKLLIVPKDTNEIRLKPLNKKHNEETIIIKENSDDTFVVRGYAILDENKKPYIFYPSKSHDHIIV